MGALLRSRAFKRTVRGMDATRISSSAEAEALAKKDSDVAPHVVVASVRKSSGPKTRVAGSSFIVSRNAIATPASRLPRTSGSVTCSSTWRGVLPRVRALSLIHI